MTKKIKNKKRKLLLSTLSLVVLVLVLVGGGVVWSGNKAKAAGVSVVGDTVTISGFIQVYLSPTDTQYDGKNLIVEGGATVRLDGSHTFKDIIVRDIAIITSSKQIKLELHADNITLTNGGRIDVSGKGYNGGVSGRVTNGMFHPVYQLCTDGFGPGGGLCTPSNNVGAGNYVGSKGGGGSYGGKGGTNNYANPGPTSSNTYGDPNKPIDYGSGGGGGLDFQSCPATGPTNGGAGGGVIAIYSNSLSINTTNSSIFANGADGQAAGVAGAGGGSGGSIYIEAGIIKLNKQTGYFPFKAVGGRGSQGGTLCGVGFSLDGSGGGGGRIALKTSGFQDLSGNPISVAASEIITVAGGGFVGGLGLPGAEGTSEGSGQIIIVNQPPIAIISGPSTTLTGATNTFVGSGSYDPDGVVVLHSWNISPSTANYVDTTTASDKNPHIRFNAPGTYTVRLTVADNLGATGFTTKTITVVDPVTINVNIVRPAGMAASAGGYDIDYNGASFSSSEIGNRIFPNQPSGLWKINPKAAAGYTVAVTSACSPTACASANPQNIAPGGTLTFTVTYTSNTQAFTCPAKPAGADWNTVSSYTQTWNGATWVPANSTTNYNTTASTTSCNYKCSTNYTWNGNACVSLVTVNVIVNKPAGMTTGAGYDIIGNGQLVASNTISATYTGASGSWGVGAHVPPAGYSVTVSPPWYQNIAAGESFNFIVTYSLISTSSGLSFIPKVTRGGQTISGTNITILPSATDPINTFEICTDKTKCQNPVRIGDLVDITAFLILAGTAGDPFMGGTASYTSTCKLVNPNTNITLNKDCNGESNRTKSGTGTGIGRKFNFILSQSGKMEIKITGNDGLGRIVTKAIIIRVPAIGTLE